MTIAIPRSVAFGSSKTGLSTVGLTLLNPDGTEHTARTTIGVYEMDGGGYGKNISFPDNWKGIIKWDSGEGSPVYAYEDYNYLEMRGDKIGYELSVAGVDAILDEVVEGATTFRQMLRLILSVLAGKSSGGGTVTLTFRDLADSKNRITATVDANGNRTTMVLDGT
jgi:hypothetical protein